jgi:predicted RNA-binding protein with RPS1 domain
MERYPVGSDAKGKIIRIVPFGAFVELEKGIDGLVHVSEAASGFVSNIADILKVGQEVSVRVLGIDPENKKINLSIKAAMPDVVVAGDDVKKSKRGSSQVRQEEEQWSEGSANTPFAELLKQMDVTK